MEKTHWKKVFNSDYLGSCDLDEGKDLKVIIKNVTVRKVKGPDGKEQERNVATFTDTKIKPMILNVSNSKVVKKFAKSVYINDWNNIPVLIYVKDDVKAFGEVTEGLRIRPDQPNITKPELTPQSQAWPKAVEYLKGKGTIDGVKAKYELSAENETKLMEESIKTIPA
jgi:hypothetical protein